MENQVNLNQPLIKSESGLLVDPSIIAANNDKKFKSEVLDKYSERYSRALNAPVPDVRVIYNYVLVRAVPPKMKGITKGGLFLNELDVDVRMLKKLEIMTENVSDEQEVLSIGNLVPEEIVKVGEMVKIDFRRYRTLNDDHTAGVIETSYEIPLYVIDGHEYMMIDSRDIIYAFPKKENTDETNNE